MSKLKNMQDVTIPFYNVPNSIVEKTSDCEKIKEIDDYEIKDYLRNIFIDKFVNKNINIQNTPCTSVLSAIKKEGRYKKIVGVLFTAGLDSTYLVLKNVAEGNYVIPILNFCNCYYNKYSGALQYGISFALAKYSAEYLHYKLDSVGEPIENISFQYHSMVNFTYTQQATNSFTLYAFGGEFLSKIDEIQIGICNEDQGVSYVNDMRNAYRAGLNFIPNKDMYKFPKFTFPLLKMYKPNISERIDDLIREYKLDDIVVTSCEQIQPSFSLCVKSYGGKKYLFVKTILNNCDVEDLKAYELRSNIICHSCQSNFIHGIMVTKTYKVYCKVDKDELDKLIEIFDKSTDYIKKHDLSGDKIDARVEKYYKDLCKMYNNLKLIKNKYYIKKEEPCITEAKKKYEKRRKNILIGEFEHPEKEEILQKLINKKKGKGTISYIAKDVEFNDVNNKDVDVII